MSAPTSTTLLDDVWQVLEDIEARQRRDAGAGPPGWVTAVFTRGGQLRILLRLPAELCRDETGTLADVAEALRGLPALTEVDLEVRPHRASAEPVRTGACWHALPGAAEVLEQLHQGWLVEEVQRPGSGSWPVITDETTVRVLVRARITERSPAVPTADSPRDAA